MDVGGVGLDLGEELGVSESRISQMRAEALSFLRDGINSQLDPEEVQADEGSTRNSKRRQAYREAVGRQSTYQSRLAR